VILRALMYYRWKLIDGYITPITCKKGKYGASVSYVSTMCGKDTSEYIDECSAIIRN
jgi:hypothetical protein